MTRTKLLVLSAITIIFCPPTKAFATTVINAASRGWIEQTGDTNGSSATNNYISGNCGLGDCSDGEFRSWFQFSIPALPGPIASARLLIATVVVHDEQGPTMTLAVTSLPVGFGFSDLGTGTFYGSRVYSAADANTIRSISLNASALADIAASELGTFGASTRISSGAIFGPTEPNQYVFGFSQADSVQLEITFIPEPSTLAICGLGLLTIVRRWRR